MVLEVAGPDEGPQLELFAVALVLVEVAPGDYVLTHISTER